VTTSRKTRKI